MRNTLLKKMREFFRSEEGATATEYAVMLALIIIVAIGAISLVGKKVNHSFEKTNQEWSDASS